MVFADNACKSDMVYIQRPSGTLACVAPETRDVLITRGWLPYSNTQMLSIDTSDSKLQDIVSANNEFAIKFYKTIHNDTKYQDKNILFSPTSLIMAFSILYEGVDGDAAKQIEKVLGFNPDAQTRHESLKKLWSIINNDKKHMGVVSYEECCDKDKYGNYHTNTIQVHEEWTDINIINSIWLTKNTNFTDKYINITQNTFKDQTNTVELFNNKNIDEINEWISTNTREKIINIYLPSDFENSSSQLISNAYFKSAWDWQFEPTHLEKSTLWTSSEEVIVDVLIQPAWYGYKYAHYDNVQVLNIPYKQKHLSITIILPNVSVGIKEIEETISVKQIEEWKSNLEHTYMYTEVPKFEIKNSHDLGRIFEQLGVKDVFDSKNNFTDATVQYSNELQIDKLYHPVYFLFDRMGTDTRPRADTIIPDGMEFLPNLYFYADHPFIFFVQDNDTGLILFMGKIVDPTLG